MGPARFHCATLLSAFQVLPSYIKRSGHCLCKAGVDRKWQESFNSFAPRLKNIVNKY